MTVQMIFSADTWAEVEEQLLVAASRLIALPALPEPITAPVLTKGKPGRKKAQEFSPGPTQGTEEEPRASPGADVADRQESLAVAQGTTQKNNGASPDPEPEVMAVSEGVSPPLTTIDQDVVELPTKELLELKEKVIDTLQTEYRKGRVDLIRDFLVTYGKGVKSFRQIDIDDFVAMDKAIRDGALA